jgi:hypothetical protein
MNLVMIAATSQPRFLGQLAHRFTSAQSKRHRLRQSGRSHARLFKDNRA